MFIRRWTIPCFRVDQLGKLAGASSSRLSQALLISWVAVSSTAALADVTLTATTPARNAAVATSSPELRLDFTGPVNVATATTDSIRLYRLGASSVTPGTDDTLVPISAITPENGGARLRVTTVNPLADGDYAWVVYGSASNRSGAGNDLHFTNNVVSLSLAAFQTLGTNFTWEAWIRLECCTTNGGHGFGAIFDVGQNGRDVPGAILQHNLADWNFYCFRQNGTSSRANAVGSVVLGAWQHICCAASTTGVKLYINGDLAASIPEACDIAAMQSTFQSAISGYTRWAGAYDYILGSIDEMRVWNVTRTQAQIRATMSTPLVGNESGLLLYHPLDEGTGNVLTDVTGHGYAGARGNAQWETSAAPMILMSPTALIGGDAVAVDANMDLLPGGVLVSPFRVDTTAPRVMDLTPALDGCAHILHPGSLAFQFDDEMDAATVIAANVSLREAGLDGSIGTGDDVIVPFNAVYGQAMRTLTVTPQSVLTNGAYRLTLSDAILNAAGISLDGEYPGIGGLESPLPSGNGAAGGPFVLDFRVNTQGDCNENDVPDACELEANDLNGNGVPDECEDCNGNGIVDECDISCAGGNGACNFAGCGQSQDCNGNLIPDECELYTTQRSLDFTNSYVRIPRSSSFEPLQELTIEAWVRPRSNGGVNNRIVRHSASFGAGYILAAGQQTGTVTRFQLQIIAGSQGTVVVADPATLSTYFGQWHHVAGVYSAISNTATLYVDGVQKAQQAAVGTLNYTDSDLFIGNFGSGENFDGQIDEVRIWKVARTQAQVTENMSRVLSENEPGLVGYWRFDEGSGQQVIDRSSKHNNGLLGNSSGVDSFDPTWVEFGAPFVEMDCNDNGTMDECDVAPGAGGDCDANGVPDECQLGGNYDCDGDGTPEICEPGGFQDCDGDGVPDACEIANCAGDDPACADCNGNGLPDECELVTTPTNLPSGFARNPANGHYYFLTPTAMTWPNAEAYAQSFGGHLATVRDASENNWLVSVFSAQQTGAVHIGFNDIQVEGTWVWASGEPVTFTNWAPGEPNSSGNEDWGALSLTTAGGLTAGQWNDASVTVRGIVEVIVDPTDCNENGVLDECDIASGASTDCDENGTPDECQLGGNYDCDGDGTPEICELGGFQDCDGDGIPNACEIAAGDSDCNANGIPDSCELATLNRALQFDGSSDYLNAGTPSELNLTNDFTIEAWVRPDNNSGFRNIVSKGTGGAGGYALKTQNGKLDFVTYGIQDHFTAGTYLTVGVWTHVAVVFDSANDVYFYINGQLVETILDTAPATLHPNPLLIGRDSPTTSGYWAGAMDEVRIWSVSRTAQQIGVYYNRALPPNEPGLVAHWRMDDGSGQIARDWSGNRLDAVLGNGNQVDTGDPAWVVSGSMLPGGDCNVNGVLDACDIAGGFSTDCDESGIPDECEWVDDCNDNGVLDLCEDGGTADCDGDGVSDWCAFAAGATDCDNDGLPDDCEAGAGNHALMFDGSNDYVQVPRSASIEPGTLTIEMWAFLNGAQTRNTRMLRKLSTRGFIFAADQDQDARIQLRVQNGAAVNVADTVSHAVYSGAWHHFAATYSATEARLYIDGQLRATTTHNAGPLTFDSQPLYFGAGFPASDTSEFFNGKLDEIRLWNHVRTQQQIEADMHKRFRSPVSGLVGHWSMDEGSGEIVGDSSGFGNHGRRGSTDLPAGDVNDPAWIDPFNDTPSLSDCNGNGIPDDCDIAGGMTSDCDENGVPDECESDCNGNGIVDSCDISSGSAADCNHNGFPDSCDIAQGTSFDANNNGVPDECEPDIQIEPVVTLVDPTMSSEIRAQLPLTLDAVTRGNYYYVEIWASDVGSTNTGLTGAYVDVNYCGATTGQEVGHGTLYTLFPGGVIQAGKVDEFGGSSLPGGHGVAPNWVRLGWIKMLATTESANCTITLTHGAGGVAALGRGLVGNSLVKLGAASVEFEPPFRSYDLDDNGTINVGDLSLFATSWQRRIPPGDLDHDFDCDGFIGASDLSWFATGWLKNVNDPSILYPHCEYDGFIRGFDGQGTDARFRITVRSSASGSDTVMTLPQSLSSIVQGQQFFVEVWASDVGDINTGLTSAYVNLLHPADAAVVSVQHHGVFNVLPWGEIGAGVIESLGGSALTSETAAAPLWVRVASVRMIATASRPVFRFELAQSLQGVAAFSRGAIPWDFVELAAAPIGTPTVGDLDGDGDIDMSDASIFVPVLLGEDLDPGHLLRADLNLDSVADGEDIQDFVNALLSE